MTPATHNAKTTVRKTVTDAAQHRPQIHVLLADVELTFSMASMT